MLNGRKIWLILRVSPADKAQQVYVHYLSSRKLNSSFHEVVESCEAADWSRNHTSFPFIGWTWAAGNGGSSVRSITRCAARQHPVGEHASNTADWAERYYSKVAADVWQYTVRFNSHTLTRFFVQLAILRGYFRWVVLLSETELFEISGAGFHSWILFLSPSQQYWEGNHRK